MNVLIVDDHAATRAVLREQLEAEAFDVCEAGDGVEALAALDRNEIDLVLSDILMPNMDGRRLCHEIRRSERWRLLPLAIYTGTHISPAEETALLEGGADKLIHKPVSAKVLAATLREMSADPKYREPRTTKPSPSLDVMREYSERLVAELEKKNVELAARNVTLLQAQQQLRLQSAGLEMAANAIVITDRSGVIVWVNPAFTTLTGYTAKEAIGQTPRLLKSGQHSQTFYRELWNTIFSGQTWRGEFINRRKDGTLFYDEHTITPVRTNGDGITHFIGIIHDVTGRKRAEEELRRTNEQLRHLLAHSPAVIYGLKVEDGKIIPDFISENITRLLGFSVAEALDYQWWTEHLHPEDRDRVVALVAKELTRSDYTIEYRLRHKDGTYRSVEDSNRAVPDASGKPTRAVGVLTDITERKKAVEALQESTTRLKAATRATNIGLWDWNLRTNEVYFSPEWKAQLGYADHELESDYVTWESRLHPDDRTRTFEELRAYIEGRQPEYAVEFRLRHRDGSYRWIYTRAEAVCDAAGSIRRILGCHVDVTERKQAEARISDALLYNRTILDASPDGIITYTSEGDVVSVNEAAAQIIGGTIEQLKAQNFRRIQSWAKYGMLAAAERALRMNQPEHLEAACVSTFGKELWLRWSFVPFQHDGKLHLLALFSDITERKQLEQNFRQAQKMESIGQLAGGVAHDFNNMLVVIRGNTELVLMDGAGMTEEARDCLKQVTAASERAANLTRQLLTFSRKQLMQLQVLDLNNVVANVTKMLKRMLGEDISLRVNRAADLGAINADVGMLEQILMNLAVNARDAMPTGGELTISTSEESIDGEYIAHHPQAVAGDYVCLSVRDTGCGIPPEILPRIFEPFFTTKEVGKGTGLGLATVYGIVRQHQGWISVYSEVGRGALFRIYFPAMRNATSKPELITQKELRGGTETILLVEDSDSVRTLVRNVLERSGYKILEANSGVTALDVWRAHHHAIALVLTDMVMPDGLTGRELAEKLRAEKPALPIIYTSGYSADVVAKGSDLRDGVNFLQKPYPSQTLLRTVRDALDKASDTPAFAS